MSDFFSDFTKIATHTGFDECRFAPIKNQELDFSHYQEWLSNNFNGNMKWMEENQDFRINLQNLFPWAKSYAILALNYENKIWSKSNNLKISKYAILNDYHYVIKTKMSQIMEVLSIHYSPIQFDFFVDSKPVLERALATNAGLGWIGKNSCLIIPRKGSWFFLGGIALNIEYKDSVKTVKNHCGNCTKCIDSCPTKALVKPYTLDARNCIAYHTIENKDYIPENIQKNMQAYIIGCDICQSVCPHNRFAKSISNSELLNDSLRTIDEDSFEKMNSSQFKKRFKNTPFLRMGFKKFQRNIKIARNQIIH